MSPETIPADIYKLLVNKEVPVGTEEVERIVEEFGEACMEMMRSALGPEQERKGRLRLSSVGKKYRQIWNDFHGVDSEKLKGPTHIKFLYGHLIEAMVLALTQLAGHTVSNQQEEVEVAGVKGHIDCVVDGEHLVDVKSASSYSFKKFERGTLPWDDPFGYVGQIKAYAHGMNMSKVGWIAMDKQNGTLAYLGYDLRNLKTVEEQDALGWDIIARIEDIKKNMGVGSPPQKCFEPVADGKSGNLRLASGCAYCQFKRSCWPELRIFHYQNGPKYLVHVEREPRVPEEVEGF